MMRKLLFSLLALFSVLLAVAFLGPGIIDWNQVKPTIADAVKRASGRDLRIDGPVELHLLPFPALSASGLRIANPPGAQGADLLKVKDLRVHVALLPLLTGKVQVTALTLIEPVVELEVMRDGRRSWDFAVPPGSGGGLAPAFQFDRVAVQNATIVWRSGASVQRLERIDARISAGSLAGPFQVEGSGVLAGRALQIDAQLGRMEPGRSAPASLKLTTAEQVELALLGSLGPGLAFSGRLEGRIADAGRFLALPAAAGQPVQLRATLDANAEVLSLDGITLRYGQAGATGSLRAAYAGTPTITATARLDRLNADGLLAALPAGGAAAGGFALPQGIVAGIDLGIDAVDAQGGLLRQLRINASLADGEVMLNQATAQLPGGAELAIFGALTAAGGNPRFDGAAELVADNLRPLLAWLKLDAGALPPDRLRSLSLQTRLGYQDGQIRLAEAKGRLDATQLAGALTMVPARRPTFGLSLGIDRLNLDAYLPATGGGAGGPPDLSLLDAFDANLQIQVGQLSVGDLILREVRANGLVQGGALALRELSVADLAGAAGRLSGTLDKAGALNLAVEASAKDVGRLARTLRVDLPVAGEQVSPAALKATARGNLATLALAGEVSLAQARATGSVDLALMAPAGIPPMALEVTHPDGARLMALAGLAAGGPVGPVKLALRTRREDGADHLEARLEALEGSLAAAGTVTGASANLALDLQGPKTEALLQALAGQQAGALGPYRLRATLVAAPGETALKGLEGTVGGTPLKGDLRVETRNGRPRLVARMNAGTLDLAGWLPPGTPAPTTAAPVPAARPAGGGGWSRERLDLTALRSMDADLTLGVDRLVWGAQVFEAVAIDAGLEGGIATLASLNAKAHGGSLVGVGRLSVQGLPAGELKLAVRDADLRGVGGSDRLRGLFSLDLDVTTRGASEWDLVNALAGGGRFSVRDGVAEGINLPAMSERLNNISQGTDLLALARVTVGGQTAFDEIGGSFVIERGVLRTSDTVARSQAADGTVTGTIDLPRQTVDLRARMILTQHSTAPPIGVRYQGPLAQPALVVETNELAPYLLRRLAPAPPVTAAPTQPVERKPADALKDIIQNLLVKPKSP
ncbi:MAG: AsmA-like C-terminal region-containing protein [Thalassobaculales bacterium]